MAAKRHIDGGVLSQIRALAAYKYTPRQIEEALADQFPADDIPHRRTIERTLARWAPPEPADPWKIAGADPDQVASVLRVLGAVMRKTKGKRRGVTVSEAAWIHRISVVMEKVSGLPLYLVAREYAVREAREEATEDLDALLAISPWKDKSGWTTYAGLLDQGVPIAPPWLLLEWWAVEGIGTAGLANNDYRGYLSSLGAEPEEAPGDFVRHLAELSQLLQRQRDSRGGAGNAGAGRATGWEREDDETTGPE